MPCAVSDRCSKFDNSRSNPIAMRGRNSRIVTSEPSRAQTEPSSSPIAPAPMTRNLFGASVKVSASVLLTIVLPSNFAKGSSIGALPVAITIFFVSISCVWPFERRHLVRFHERAHAAGECFYNLVLALLHLREIDTCAVDHDAVLLRFLFREHKVIARSQKRFARNAADVQTGAA